MARDATLACLNKLIALVEEMLRHDGYGDIEVRVRLAGGGYREVTLLAGKEYRFLIAPDAKGSARPPGHFRVIAKDPGPSGSPRQGWHSEG